MGRIKKINCDIFKIWNGEMAYILGYIFADGCISFDKNRKKNPYTLNITSIDKKHLYKIRKSLNSSHKVGKKTNGRNGIAFQLQIRNSTLCEDLINLGIKPRKTYNTAANINIPDKYFHDFTRGFFDGDGTVYIYRVNNVPQIKAGFLSTSPAFFEKFNLRLCKNLNITKKNIHLKNKHNNSKLRIYDIHLYIGDCEKLAEFMYQNNPSLYLNRKYRIFEKWKSIKRRRYLKHDYPSKIGWQLNKNLVRI